MLHWTACKQNVYFCRKIEKAVEKIGTLRLPKFGGNLTIGNMLGICWDHVDKDEDECEDNAHHNRLEQLGR